MLPRVAAFAGSCLVAFASVFSAQTPNGSAPARPDFGTTDRILVLVGGEEFQPRSSGQAWGRETGIYSIGGIAAFDATLHLPSGARLVYLELDYCDTAPGEVLVFLEDCSFLGGGCAGLVALSSNDGNPGCSYVTSDLPFVDYTVNNNSRRLRLIASTQSGSNTNQLIGVYIGYKLQVSPAPAGATYTDVPTTHPLFQFVEALSRSGITAGCGGGNFCPDAPLTRGQMAVFLAVALGFTSRTEKGGRMLRSRLPWALAGAVLMSLGTAASSLAQSPQTRVPRRPKWGGSSRILYAVAATEFSPASSDVTYFDAGGQPGRYATVADGLFYATAHLPSGVLLTYVELDYCDNDSAPGHDVVLGLTSCPFAGLVCTPIGTVLSSSDGATGCGHVLADLTPLGYVVDNNVGRLMLNARTQSGDSGNVLIGAYLGYKLQVSAAPASATFLDVPTTHPYFRFVEALASAGITGGCGGGNYCVNAPITRGEMAVFLAAALGLHFPN